MDVLGLLATAAFTKGWVVDSPPMETPHKQQLKAPSNQRNVSQEFLPLTPDSVAQVMSVYKSNVQVTSEQFTTEQNRLRDRGSALETYTQVTPVHQLDVQPSRESFTTDQNPLRNPVEALETRVSDLEVQQFSPTAFLTGEVVWGVSGVSGNVNRLLA